MLKKNIVIAFSFFVSCSISVAAFNNDTNPSGIPRRKDRGRKIESWYYMLTYAQIPSSSFEYKSGKPEPINSSGIRFSVELIRFYWSLNNRLLLGPCLNLSFDGGRELTSGLFTLSTLFFIESIGDGFYLRGDFGISNGKFAYCYDTEDDTRYPISFGYIVGVGFAHPLSSETSLIFEAYYRYLDLKSNNASINATLGSFCLSFGVLW